MSYPWPLIDTDAEIAVRKQLHTTTCIYNKSGIVAEFEDAFAALHGSPFALLTSSGTAALHSAFYALELAPGDEVICPNYTFFATAMPLFQLGALPVLADCDADGSISPLEIQRLVTPRTKAVVVTHMWGYPCDMQSISKLCRNLGLGLVEDCSHAHGATFDGQMVGTFGDVGAWSLQAQKIIGAGEGGILLTGSREIYDRAQLLGHFNKRCLEEMDTTSPLYAFAATGMGLKYRAHPLGVALAASQLPKLGNWLECKRQNAARLSSIIETQLGIRLLSPPQSQRKCAFYALVFLVEPTEAGFSRDELVAALVAEGFTDADIPNATSPLHTFALFQNPQSPVTTYRRSCVRGNYPLSTRIAAQSVKISVPVETIGRGLDFVEAFELVWNKVTRGLTSQRTQAKI